MSLANSGDSTNYDFQKITMTPVYTTPLRRVYFYWSLLFGFVFWFAWEFAHAVKLTDIPWGSDGVLHLSIFSFVAVGLFLVIRTFLGRYAVLGLMTVGIVTAVGVVGIAPIVTVGVFWFSATLLGEALFNALGLQSRDFVHRLIQLTLGVGTYAVLIALMALQPINYAAVYFSLLVAPMLIWQGQAKRLFEEVRSALRLLNTLIERRWLFSLMVFYFLALYLCVALLPEVGYDALVMHLTVPAYVAEHHRWGFDVEKYVWAVMPMNGDCIYTLTYMLGGEAASRLANLALSLTIFCMLLSAVRIWAAPRMAMLAAAIFFTLPLTFLEASTLYIENAWTMFLFGSILCVLLFAEQKESRYLLAASALLGIALGTKVIAVFLVVPLLMVSIYYIYRNLPSGQWKKLMTWCVVIFVAIGVVPYLIAYVKTGNPVFPFYNAIFKSPYYDSVRSFIQPTYNKGFNLLSLRDATFNSSKYIEGITGSFGWVFFVILPLSALASISSRAKFSAPLVFVSILFIALTFHFQSYLRYIFPAIPILILIMMQGIESLRSRSEQLGLTVILVTWLLAGMSFAFLPAANGFYRDFAINSLLSASARDEFVANRTPVRDAVEYINATHGAQVGVGFLSAPFAFDLKGTPYFGNWYNSKFAAALYKVSTEDQMAKLLKDNLIDMIILEDSFNPGNGFPLLVPLAKAVTTLEKQYAGGVSVRSLRKELFFSDELLENADFRGISGWLMTDAAQFQPETHTIRVTAQKIATQVVAVRPGASYLLTTTVRCVTPGSLFRMQVNWLNSNGEMVGLNLTPKACSDKFETYQETVRAPADVAVAAIYAAGHAGEDQVEYSSLSFKR